MPNSYLYILLVVSSLLILSVVLFIKKDPRIIVLHFAIAGITHPFEVVVTILLAGYRFMPHILPIEWFDNIMGAFASDLFIIPAAAVVIAVFDLGFASIAGIAVAFMGIEILFLHTGIYEHYWWKTIYTGLGLVIYFPLAKYFWQRIRSLNSGSMFHLLILFLCYIMVHGPLTVVPIALYGKYIWTIGWYADPIKDHIVFGVLYLYVIAAISAIIIWPRTKMFLRLLGLVAIYGIDCALLRLGILTFLSDWNLLHLLATHIAALIILVFFNSIIVRDKGRPRGQLP